jgi:hypothetical protein
MDAAGNAATVSVSFSVTSTSTDTTPPVFVSWPKHVTVSADDNGQGVVPDVLSNIVATDNVTPTAQLVMSQNPAAGTVLGNGKYSITVTVTDTAGNSASKDISLKITDRTAPVIQSISVNPNVLANVNNKFVPVTVSAIATDNCDASPECRIVRIRSNDPDCDHDRDCDDGIQITGQLTAKLQASHNDGGRRRVYTITVRCTDASGNSSKAEVTVTVPKDDSGGGRH